MYDALLAGAAGVSATEQDMLRAVRSQVAGWRLRKRFAGNGAEAYRKATAFEALVRPLLHCFLKPMLQLKAINKLLSTVRPACTCLWAAMHNPLCKHVTQK